MTEEMLTPDYFRWLYTAFTRATDILYLVNWPKEQIEEEQFDYITMGLEFYRYLFCTEFLDK